MDYFVLVVLVLVVCWCVWVLVVVCMVVVVLLLLFLGGVVVILVIGCDLYGSLVVMNWIINVFMFVFGSFLMVLGVLVD